MLKVNGKNVNEQNIDGVSMLVNYNTNSNTRLVKRMYVSWWTNEDWKLKCCLLNFYKTWQRPHCMKQAGTITLKLWKYC